MGCVESRSKVGVLEDKQVLKFGSYRQIINEKCPKIRTDTINATKTLKVETSQHIIEMKYAYVSQRGYYPHALGKANQDSYTICESMLGDPNCHFFGIFDGHGEHGDHCSYYCAEKTPYFLQQALMEKGGTNALNDIKTRDEIFHKSFDITNLSLHKSNIEDNLSGTTGITVLLKDSTLHVANVGDSRAIIAGQVDGYLKYSALSSDQTPYRADERERLKKCGATIMTLDQLEGREPIHENWGAETGDTIDESGDPPRVWDKSLERPGCAFTRSFGDAVAEIVGVNAVPEILTWDLSSLDKYIIIASDGVFEFLTSQNVVNIISQYQDIIEGARRVVEESYRLWLTYDERTDDISIIIISIDSFIDKKVKGTTVVSAKIGNTMKRMDSNASNNKSGYSTYSNVRYPDNKPVRRVISKVRRKEISENWVSDDDYDYDFARHVVKKVKFF
jgi:serine/threonine protein phosphatase PrpC